MSYLPLRYRLALSFLLAIWYLAFASALDAASPKLSEIIDKAKSEGEVVFQAPDPETGLPTGTYLQDIANLVDKQFGVKIRVKIDNSLNFPGSVAKALTEIKSGAPPSYDLMIQNSISGIPLVVNKAIEPVPWLEIAPHLTKKELEWNGSVPVVDTQFLLPLFNSQLVKAQDVPKSYDDVLNPKWKGKLAMFINFEPWALLASPKVWGEPKVTNYLEKLLELNPKVGRFPETFQRVVSGEASVAVHGQRERALFYRKQRGAPIDVAQGPEPALTLVYVFAVPKGARNSNAAILAATALTTKEGRELHRKYRFATSMFTAGSEAAEFASKHKVVVPEMDYLTSKKFAEIAKKVRAIIVRK